MSTEAKRGLDVKTMCSECFFVRNASRCIVKGIDLAVQEARVAAGRCDDAGVFENGVVKRAHRVLRGNIWFFVDMS
jgi:hypothetical protein